MPVNYPSCNTSWRNDTLSIHGSVARQGIVSRGGGGLDRYNYFLCGTC